MIQPTAPVPLPAIAQPGEAAAVPPGDPAVGADFGAVLARQDPTSARPEGTALALPAAATLAAIPAIPGKVLPPALPDPASGLPQQAQPAMPAPAILIRLPDLAPGKPAKAEAQSDQAPPAEPDDAAGAEVLALPRPADLPAVAPAANALVLPDAAAPPAKGRPAKPETEPEAEPVKDNSGQAAIHRTIPALPTSASDSARAQMLRHAAPAAPVPADPAPKAARPAAIPAEEVRLDLALPRITGRVGLARDELLTQPKLAEIALSEAATGQPSAPLQAATLAPASPLSQVRPHDFAALIERIAVAREAAASQAVSITVSHQDFGQVRLNFRPEDAGLSVSMTSADPDFARAAAAMPAPVMPVAQGEQAELSQHQRGDGNAAQNGGQPQSRGGGSPDQRRDGQPQSNPAPRTREQGSAQRAGIFA